MVPLGADEVGMMNVDPRRVLDQQPRSLKSGLKYTAQAGHCCGKPQKKKKKREARKKIPSQVKKRRMG